MVTGLVASLTKHMRKHAENRGEQTPGRGHKSQPIMSLHKTCKTINNITVQITHSLFEILPFIDYIKIDLFPF